ncbi:MAG: outer membrane beta-barrel protein [Bacteroidetes bacterium]|nr:outer membrane beta-barrel protein [Bacteroidota bacterium]
MFVSISKLIVSIFILLLLTGIVKVNGQTKDENEDGFLDTYDITAYFSYKILLPGQMPDSIPLKSTSSGGLFIGLAMKIKVSSLLNVHLSPGINFSKLIFQELDPKTFPSDSGNVYESEKLIMNYAELPIGLRFNIVKNDIDQTVFSVEVGGYAGILINSVYKLREVVDEKKLISKITPADGLEQFRYGIFIDIAYKNISFITNYRLSDIFQASAKYSKSDPSISFGMPYTDPDGKFDYPVITPFELGLKLEF